MAKVSKKNRLPKSLLIIFVLTIICVLLFFVLKIVNNSTGRSVSGTVTHTTQGPTDAPTGEGSGYAKLLVGTEQGLRAALKPQSSSYPGISQYQATLAEIQQNGVREVKVSGNYRFKLNNQENALCTINKSTQTLKDNATPVTYYSLNAINECVSFNPSSAKVKINVSTIDFGKGGLTCINIPCESLKFTFD